MSSSEVDAAYGFLTSWPVIVAIIIAGAALATIAAYRSFTLGRAFPIPSYRSRALWLGVANLSFVGFIASYLTSTVFPIVPFLANDVIGTVLGVVFFLWIDSTINVALSQDYFHRNTLYWRQLRIAFWIGVVLATIESGVIYAVPTEFNYASPLYLTLFVSYAVLFGYAGAVLVVGGARTTDAAMKTHFRWIALGLGGAIFVVILPYALFPIVGDLILVAFYKASRSLYPVGHFNPK